MKTVAIISEYNPFHSGHAHQIERIRDEFGSDTRIIAIMSGNFTQRGELAIADKTVRAECAVRCGANLVLELPFPFSMSSAEFFAKSGVRIADRIGAVDVLSFGSESGDIDSLSEIAKNMDNEEYLSLVNSELTKSSGLGYPKVCEAVYKKLYNTEISSDVFTPNNILAIEYLKALKREHCQIVPHTIKREGADYNDDKISDSIHQSASAIRVEIFKKGVSAFDYIPKNSKPTLLTALEKGQLPCDADKLSAAVISHLRLNPDMPCDDIHDAMGGLYNRLQGASRQASTISSLIALADTKKYTTARIRRALWNSYFGVTSSKVKELPLYTQALAMDGVGKSILKEIKKKSQIPIVTKPSAYDFLPDAAKRQKEFSDAADSVFQLSKPAPQHAGFDLVATPFIMD